MEGARDRMDQLVSLCKRRGFIYPGSELYGGFANSWDYGPYGVELKRNIRDAWWSRFVHGRADVYGLETPIIMNPKAWEASGHLETFTDPLVDCKKCKHRFRADQLVDAEEEKTLDLSGIRCPNCGGELTDIRQFNLMFKTFVGVTEDASSAAFLRPETAGGMFVAWKNVRDSLHRRLPFGIAQIGKAFRNEITPGNFIFRTREFEQMEIEYFVHPSKASEAFDMWLQEMKSWVADVLHLSSSRVVYKDIPREELAHYSARTVDIEYRYPFGQKELYGLANRTDYDLSRHQDASGEDLRYLDPDTNERFLPYVIEPTWGADRSVLAVLLEHLDIDEAKTAEGEKEPRMVLRLPPRLAPVQAAILPLQKKEPLVAAATELAATLRGAGWSVEYDETGSIGKRYRRQDEIGTPWCITVDPQTADDHTATIRDRDAMSQERVALRDIPSWIADKVGRRD
ncbi:glycine--tRNA ligase [Patescibacteria group bacterium]|uniref:Glycine--tRNA ligase n=1 Tax=candidate division WWE3 bacterium TaxID=2053526 RepID=A0A928Y6F1_UNCKA|nr:glycine--tRNA ligase [candidate division WWE3 bacterium]MCL4733059.1 glycine--tRNA ligase [Patescibacteria group bacterium]MDL1953314.1 glycine--tRNA ligase [Candidatus Uhrbacteria bacterium UHB]RIL00543.1 MAG: glycine--tRNA ligase [Candidatus Uhrbacteria bacterium]